jgi:hypothetical protein
MKDGNVICAQSWWVPDVDPRQSALVETEIERKGLVTLYVSHLMEQVCFATHGTIDTPLWLMAIAAASPLTRCRAALNAVAAVRAVAAARAAVARRAQEMKGEQV